MNKSLCILFTSIALLLIFTVYAPAQMFWNQAASYDGGVASKISVPNSSSLNITGSFTLEAWINPVGGGSGSKTIISKGTSPAYGMTFFDVSKKIIVSTGGFGRITSTNTVPYNQWTHIATTFNSSTSIFSIYINGVLDISATIAGSSPPSNSDSLFIGNGGSVNVFKGMIDEVRIWNKVLSNADINLFRKTSLGATGGIYNGLVLSMTFQDDESFGTDFSTLDMSGNNNNGFNKGVDTIDLSNNPSNTIAQNDCIQLDGNNDYLAGVDSVAISATNTITIECWIFPLILTSCSFVMKGPIASPDYQLNMGGTLGAQINGIPIAGGGSPTLKRWNHIAFTYSGSTGEYKFYKDAILVASGNSPLGNITNSTDSLFIGGGVGSVSDFNGYMDEIRISRFIKSQDEIKKYMYESMDATNNSAGHFTTVCYNLDGLTLDNNNDGGPRLFFRNNAKFSHSSAAASQPVSPLNRADALNFSEGYYLKTSNKKIPSVGTSGSISDSLSVNINQTISDINFYVALNHMNSTNLEISLIAPNGDSVKVFDNNSSGGNSDNIVTIFDDNADSITKSNAYTNFSNVIRPVNSMSSAFSGDNSLGTWKIRINDQATNDTGLVYAWGVQINNQPVREKNLNLSVLIQGFFNTTTQLMVPDTILVVLRNSTAPFTIVDSSKAVADNFGKTLFSFDKTKVFNNVDYYIQVNHRNSIETWSFIPVIFLFSEAAFDFTSSPNKAFGNNQIFLANVPSRYGIYSGDPNQDGSVNLSDIVEIFNSATNFQSGYIRTDVTGDNIANLSDIILTFNNSNFFVQ